MKSRSAKAKGRRLQQEVQQKLLESFPGILEDDDVKVAIMGESGVDIELSPLARKHIPYSIECKNTEKIAVWQALKQATENTREGTEPAVVFRRNNSETYAIIRFEHLVELMRREKCPSPHLTSLEPFT